MIHHYKDKANRHHSLPAALVQVTAAVTLNGREMVMPGDNAEVTCELIHPMPVEEVSLCKRHVLRDHGDMDRDRDGAGLFTPRVCYYRGCASPSGRAARLSAQASSRRCSTDKGTSRPVVTSLAWPEACPRLGSISSASSAAKAGVLTLEGFTASHVTGRWPLTRGCPGDP